MFHKKHNESNDLPAPMNHVQVFKGQPRHFALSELVQAWHETFACDHVGRVEINDSSINDWEE